jgi:hypothetical protein
MGPDALDPAYITISPGVYLCIYLIIICIYIYVLSTYVMKIYRHNGSDAFDPAYITVSPGVVRNDVWVRGVG